MLMIYYTAEFPEMLASYLQESCIILLFLLSQKSPVLYAAWISKRGKCTAEKGKNIFLKKNKKKC